MDVQIAEDPLDMSRVVKLEILDVAVELEVNTQLNTSSHIKCEEDSELTTDIVQRCPSFNVDIEKAGGHRGDIEKRGGSLHESDNLAENSPDFVVARVNTTTTNQLLVNCKYCNLEINRKSLQRHIRNKHCNFNNNIDNNGIVRKSTRIQKSCYSENSKKNVNIKLEETIKPIITNIDPQIVCKICSKTFTRRHDLKKHVLNIHKNIKTEKNSLLCYLCKKQFKNKRNLKHHIENLHSNKVNECKNKIANKNVHKCKICEKILTRAHDLRRHLKVHENKNKLFCNECQRHFRHMSDLRTHIINQHLANYSQRNEKQFKYQIYEKKFTLKKHLKRHNKNIHEKKGFNCKICRKSYASKSTLQRHIRNTHKNCKIKNSSFVCSICKKCFKLEKYLKNHVKFSHKNPVLTCYFCNYKVRDKNQLRFHMKTIHFSSIFVQCDICHSKFKKISLLKQHSCYGMKIIENIEEYKNIAKKCKNCNKICKNSINLKYHVKFECEKNSCSLCKNVFISQNELKNHVTEIHSNLIITNRQLNQLFLEKINVNIAKSNVLVVNKYANNWQKCHICQKLLLKGSLNFHINIYHNYLNCEHCRFSTRDKNDLILHITKSHLQLQSHCKICNFKSQTNLDLQKHIFYVHNGNTMSCKFCDYQTKHQHRLDWHLKHWHEQHISNKTNTFDCNICQKSFLHLKNLKRHIKNHVKLQNNVILANKIQQYKCRMCGSVYESMQALNTHQKFECTFLANTTKVILSCDLCAYKTIQKTAMYKHMKDTHRFVNKFYKCAKCDKNFTSRTYLDRHFEGVHEIIYRECKICGAKVKVQRFYQHMHVKHQGVYKFDCQDCNETFDSPMQLSRHKKYQHGIIKLINPNYRPFKCQFCPKSFKQSYRLISHHQNIHTQSKPVICEKCGKLLKNLHSLKYHILKLHSNDQSQLFTCTYCDKTFIAKSQKIAHEISIHKQNIKIIESKFEEIFQGKKSSKVAQIDADLLPELTCQICGKIATSKCNLKAHVYSKHSDLRPIKCGQCERSFKYNRELKMHSLSHTNEKPLKCPTCDFATKKQNSLKYHVISKHANVI